MSLQPWALNTVDSSVMQCRVSVGMLHTLACMHAVIIWPHYSKTGLKIMLIANFMHASIPQPKCTHYTMIGEMEVVSSSLYVGRLLVEEDHPLEIYLDAVVSHRKIKLVLRDDHDAFSQLDLQKFTEVSM